MSTVRKPQPVYPWGIPLSGKAGRKAESTFFEGKKAELAPFKKKGRNCAPFFQKRAESAFDWRRQGGIAKIENGGIAGERAELTLFREKRAESALFPEGGKAERNPHWPGATSLRYNMMHYIALTEEFRSELPNGLICQASHSPVL